ncbi:MAG TPA: BamA/TamA family outer membrane protein [Saprospiraceae bacterium]|nr:BamA/TamA family outer membrane protein [Saprospiraceae bacterium]
MIRLTTYLLVIGGILALAGCTGMRYVTSADPLFTGNEIKFEKRSEANKGLSPAVHSVLKPSPNNKALWMRPALARFNMLSDSAKVKKFWKNKIAPPVLLSQTNPVQISAAIHDRLFHAGYFDNTIVTDTLFSGHRKAKYKYTITIREPYRIAAVNFPKPQNELTKKISDLQGESLLKKDDIYLLEAVKNERIRIDRELKEQGYIYFSPDFLLVKADSVSGHHQLNTEITVKPETPPESKKAFTIRNVYIHDDNGLDANLTDTIRQDSYFLISQTNTLKFDVLRQGIFLKPGDLYARSNALHTIRYLNELSIFRNANLKFIPVAETDQVDVMAYLSQRKRFAYTADFNTVFRSTNYFGPGVIFSYTDRNANRGAELLKINLRGSFEMQIIEGDFNPAYQLGVDINYLMPGFFPKALFKGTRKNLPQTSIAAGYNLFNRLDLYRLNSTYGNFGYRWSKTDRMQHSLNILEATFTKLPEDSKSQEFIDYLAENPGVQRSFDEQFILGAGYEYTYNPVSGRRNDFYFRGGIDAAGNVLNGIYAATNATKDSLGRYTFLGVPFSQYIRTRVDLRYSFVFRKESSLVTRFSAGVGIPTGNSEVLPYIKQFYVGGTNSLRSFVARALGPGSEVPPEGYNDLTGDIRLEGNLEYRFQISGSLKGALFIDAGNVWLFNEDPSRPDANFTFDSFLDEIAISSGWGLRWDFNFIVLRLDFAYTLRTPYLAEGDRWAGGINFWRPALNIAIGYPF